VVVGLVGMLGMTEGLFWMVPLDGMDGFEDNSDNTDLDTATHFHDTNRLEAVYGRLEGLPHYYSFDIESRAERVVIKLYRPSNEDDTDFYPGMTLMGPSSLNVDFDNEVDLQNNIEVPIGYDTRSRANRATIGVGIINFLPPFGYFELDTVVLTDQEPGRYFIAVFAHGATGNFGLSVGEVEWFYFTEFILGPIYGLKHWQWTGQSIGLVLLPLYLFIIGGIGILSWQSCYQRNSPKTYFSWVVCMGGFIIMSSAFVVVEETIYVFLTIEEFDVDWVDIWVTVFWVLCPVMLGFLTIFIGLMTHVNALTRFILFLIAILSMLVWSGYYAGAFLLLVGALLPTFMCPYHVCFPWMRKPHEEEEGADDEEEEEEEAKEPEKEKLLKEEPAIIDLGSRDTKLERDSFVDNDEVIEMQDMAEHGDVHSSMQEVPEAEADTETVQLSVTEPATDLDDGKFEVDHDRSMPLTSHSGDRTETIAEEFDSADEEMAARDVKIVKDGT